MMLLTYEIVCEYFWATTKFSFMKDLIM